MTIYYTVAILAGIAGIMTPLFYLVGKLTKPIKKMTKDCEDNKRDIEALKVGLKKLEADIERRDFEAAENRAITIKSLLTIVDTLQSHGHNGGTKKLKTELVNHISKRAGGKK